MLALMALVSGKETLKRRVGAAPSLSPSLSRALRLGAREGGSSSDVITFPVTRILETLLEMESPSENKQWDSKTVQ